MRRLLLLSFALLGLFDSLYLTWVYTSPSHPMVCLGTGCDAVRASLYARLLGLPVPVYGVVAYAALALLVVGEGLVLAQVARLIWFAVTGISAAGFLFSLYLTYLEAFVIHAYCAWCVVSALTITCITALSILELGRVLQPPAPAVRGPSVRSRILVCMAAVIIGAPTFFYLSKHGEASSSTQAVSLEALGERLLRPDSHVFGDPRAPVKVVEFGDFECPACGRAEEVAREVRAKFGDRICFVFRQFPLYQIHPQAEKAAEASECAADQGKFWQAVDRLYAGQADLSVNALARYAGELGLDQNRFRLCLDTGAKAARIRRDLDDAHALGLIKTPTFFVGRFKFEGALPFAQFSQLIDQQIAEQHGTMAQNAQPAASAATAPHAGKPDKAQTKGSSEPSAGTMTFGSSSNGGLFSTLQTSSTACSEEEAAKKQPAMIGTAEVRQLYQNHPGPVFVDVRSPKDFAAGHVAGAVNIPVDDLEQRWNALSKDRTNVLYESGRSSGDICAASRAAGRILLAHGFSFDRVKVYQDGLAAWEKAGLPVQR
jgi:protein-disulfide isomerase/uncharacterized membrane protein/rhodanese-related sulfurtransferase